MQLNHENLNELDTNEISNFLEEHTYAHLGCQVDGEVYIVPIKYVYDSGNIYCFSKNGKKIDMMRKNPNICVQVEAVENLFHWKSVIVWGKFQELKGGEAAKGIRLLNKRLIQEQEVEKTSDLTADFERLFEDAVIFRIKIDKKSGRFEK